MRIQHLINQYPVIQDVTGDIRFVIDDEGRLAKASLTLEDGDFDRLWASGIKLPLIELFDALIIYRRQHGFDQLTKAHLSLDRGGVVPELEGLIERSAPQVVAQ